MTTSESLVLYVFFMLEFCSIASLGRGFATIQGFRGCRAALTLVELTESADPQVPAWRGIVAGAASENPCGSVLRIAGNIKPAFSLSNMERVFPRSAGGRRKDE